MSKDKAGQKAGHAPAPAGADNNTRLAFLEAGTSAIAAACVAAGIPLKDDQDPLAQAAEVIMRWKELTLARAELAVCVAATLGVSLDQIADPLEAAKGALQTMLAEIQANAAKGDPTAELAEAITAGEHEILDNETPLGAAIRILSAPPEGATPGELSAIARAEKAEDALNQALEQIKAIEAGEPITIAEPKVERGAAECGPTFNQATAEELRGLIDEGQHFELVFSNGEHEVVEFAPVPLTSRDLVLHGNRYMVDPTVTIAGPRGDNAAPLELAGAALLCHGEQIAYAPFERPLQVSPGDHRAFNRTFLFG